MTDKNPFAITGFTIAIVACITFMYPVVGAVAALIAVVFSLAGYGKKDLHKGLAKAGLILGIIALILSIITTGYFFSCGAKTLEPVVVCPAPYINDNSGCCLDMDDNFVCDKDEGAVVIEEVEEEEEVIVEEEVVEEEEEAVDEEVVVEGPTYEEEEPPETIYDLFAPEIEYFSTLFDDTTFETNHMDVQPDRQMIGVGQTGVYLIRIKNIYDTSVPHYYEISLRGSAIDWIINADETGTSSYTIGPISTQDDYIDIPVFITVDDMYGTYSNRVTEGGESYKFTFSVLESDKLEYAYFKSIPGERSFEVLVAE